jgi:hypothetical protein
MPRSPYPLQWPADTPRTKPADRRRSKFYDRRKLPDGRLSAPQPLSLYETAKELLAELGRLRASHVVITSMLPTRHDGLPYSDGRSEDPGVAVWCVYRGRERVFACDEWTTPAENIRAITLSIDALRGLARWGMADVAERAFAGFAALPPGAPEPPPKRDWRAVFGVAELVDTLMASSADDLLAVVKARHRKMIAECHPDAGGDTARAAELNAALDEAEKELAQP